MLTAEKDWQLRQIPADVVRELQNDLGVSPLIARLLALRGVGDSDHARFFLSKRLADLHRPEQLSDMAIAAKRLAKAINEREPILIHGDFDVDGSTASTLVKLFCQACSHDATVWIPHRVDDGYGMSESSINAVREAGAKLMITVDCGIADGGIAGRIERELSCDVIITDHHLPQEHLPDCIAVVNPNHPDSTYPDRGLAGVGVAWKLCWATACELCGSQTITEQLRGFMLDSLSLVAIGTVADCAPMDGENRILVHHGLQALAKTRNHGLRGLLEQCRLSEQITTGDVGWRIGPLLNASGRLSSAMRNVDLLCARDAATAEQLLNEVVEENNERRRLSQILTEDLFEEIDRCQDHLRRNSLVFAGDSWHPGVIGIVASRLTERFGKPSCVIAIENGVGKGSLRTVDGVHLANALTSCQDHIITGGGHAAAAGLTIAADQVPAFADAFEAFVCRACPGGVKPPSIDYDASVSIAEIDDHFFASLDALAPFGVDNPEPLLQITGARWVSRPQWFGKNGDHLRGAITDAGGGMRSFYSWRGKERFIDADQPGRPFNTLVRPENNLWRGNRSPRLVFVDGSMA